MFGAICSSAKLLNSKVFNKEFCAVSIATRVQPISTQSALISSIAACCIAPYNISLLSLSPAGYASVQLITGS